MKKLFLTAFLAALGLASTASAQVQTNLGDLILSFRATGGTGQNVNLEVDLGSVAQFQGLAAGSSLSVSRLAVNDLIATYGAGWATRTDLFWSVVGTAGRVGPGPGGSPIATLWATNAELTVGTQSTAWTPASNGAQFIASSQIEALQFSGPGSLNGATATANSSNSSAINGTLAGSYSYQDTFQPGTSFSFFNPTVENTVNAGSGTYAVSDLYEVRPGTSASTYLGSFGLSKTGTLTFSTSLAFFTGSSSLPVITTQPASQTIAAGGNATFTVAATSATALTYQWLKDGTPISGATSSTLTLSAVSAANAGNYSVVVSNGSGSTTVSGYGLIVGVGRIINCSLNTTLDPAGSFTLAYVIGPAGTSGNKPVLMRADGPSLVPLGFYTAAQVVPDPTLQFYNGSTLVTQNAGWAGDANILATSAAVGAFPFASATSKDSAIYVSAAPLGNDSVIIKGASATSTGTVIAEIYDATPTAQFGSTTPRLINVSVQKNVGSFIIVGFTIGGSANVKVLVRAVGPTLGSVFNVPGTIADPKMTLYNTSNVAIASNDDWGTPVGTGAATAAQITAAATASGAYQLAAGGKDSALLMSLPPGGYTAIISPSTGATGLANVEVYEVP